MMLLDDDENKVKTFHHHFFPFVIRTVELVIVSLPVFIVATFFQGLLGPTAMFWTYVAIGIIFLLFWIYEGAIYFLDRLVITNKRIIHVEWKSLFEVDESEAEFDEIQDIETREHGILSAIPLFDYGDFEVSTASSKNTIVFNKADDPEGIKHFVYHLQLKPSRIMEGSSIEVLTDSTTELPNNDRTKEAAKEEVGISGNTD